MKLILITFTGCPNAEIARALLHEAGLSFTDMNQDELPPLDPHQGYTSPTLLAHDKIVFGSRTTLGASGCSVDIPHLDELNRRLAAMDE